MNQSGLLRPAIQQTGKDRQEWSWRQGRKHASPVRRSAHSGRSSHPLSPAVKEMLIATTQEGSFDGIDYYHWNNKNSIKGINKEVWATV
ncbi:MAG: hypothetical protein HPY30_07935 [Gammaproteobacteria bacterium (ex Lamellibrachia satsuma)]|nr:MAG: hypothetical protein HPY30_07935 [Gammaproteobacteria bacterium (ex Lamellibrachia satsuma)]